MACNYPRKKQGNIQDEDKKSGVPYIRWPESIVASKILISSVQDLKGTKIDNSTKEIPEQNTKEFRDQFIAKHRATDGHFVRSKAEMIIDNWLYMAEIVD